MKTAVKLSPKDQLKIEAQYLETLKKEIKETQQALLNRPHSYADHLAEVQRIVTLKKDIEKQTKKIAKLKEKC